MRRAKKAGARAAGLTMVELVVAAGLMSLLFVALFSLLEDFLTLWKRSEERRAVTEETSGVLELVAADLSGLEAGQRGDIVCEWIFFDTDSDGIRETKWPRLRLIRNASPAELQRLVGFTPADEDPTGLEGEQRITPQGLLEVIWVVLPAVAVDPKPDQCAEGFLWRGERVFGPDRDGDISFFSDGYIGQGGVPRPGTVNEVSGGILWLGLRFATQTSLIHEGWTLGGALGDVAASWDAWSRGRPDAQYYWNEPGSGMPPPRGRPAIPRRVRLELELEHRDDLKFRTRLTAELDTKSSTLRVLDHERLPAPGAHLLVGGEWMELLGVSGGSASVRRGARGTTPTLHEAGVLVHHGATAVREVPIATFREDWNL